MNKMNDLGLPASIRIRISSTEENSYMAELVEYGIHTEADSRSGLDYMINDLIYAYFDVPKKYQGEITYRQRKLVPKPKMSLKSLLLYQQYVESNPSITASS